MASPIDITPDKIDLTKYATADEIANPGGDTSVAPVLPPTGLKAILGRVPLLAPRINNNSWWVPYTRHVYYPELDHGYRGRTDGIVLHVNDGYYQGTLDFFHNNGGVGAHFEIGFQSGQITQMVPINRKCWHAVNANANTIGVEHAGFGRSRSEWLQNHEYEIVMSAQRVAWMLHRYNLGKPQRHKNIFYHSDGGAGWGNHDCPGSKFPYDVWSKHCMDAFIHHWAR